MEKTPSSGKRIRSELSTPESDIDNKRQCNIESPDLDNSDTFLIMEDPNNTSTEGVNDDMFHDKLLKVLRSKEIMSAISSTVAEVIHPMFREEMETLISQNKQLVDDISSLNKKLDEKEAMIENLNERLDRSEQYSRRNNVRITGISETKGESTDDIVIDLADRCYACPVSPAHVGIRANPLRAPG